MEQFSVFLNFLLSQIKASVTIALILAVPLWSTTTVGATLTWGVAAPGTPGVYSWQHLNNWNANGLHLTPIAIPGVASDVADLSLLTLQANQTINLDGSVTLGTLNIGSIGSGMSYTIAAGTGGSLTFNNGGTAALNKTGLGFDAITSNIVLADPTTFNVSEGALMLSGVISGTGGITKEGDGLLVLRNTNTFTGVSTLNGGITLLATIGNDNNALGATGAAQATVINTGATLALSADTFGSAFYSANEPLTLNGNGFRNNGALRNLMGANGNQVGGVITLASASRVQNDQAGTFTLTNSLNVNNLLSVGGVGFVDVSGAVSGSSDITHFGLSGFRMRNTTTTQTYSGALTSLLGEIRADYGTDGLPLVGSAPRLNPYAGVTELTLKSSWLRMAFGNAAGSATNDDSSNSTPDSRFSTTAPISMMSSQIYIDNASFSSTTTNFFDYAVIQHLGVTTMTGGHNRIGFRSADTGSVALTFAGLQKPNPGTTMEFLIDSLVGASLGTSAKHQIINTALEGGGNIAFLGGWAYSAGGTASPEFVKYGDTTLGGFGYTTLSASDYAVDTAVGTWAAGQNIKLSTSSPALGAGTTTIQSLNMQNATARTLSGAAGATLVIGSGGILTSGGTHTISVPFLTAGADSNYELYDIAWSTNVITSDITDNGGNPVSLVKTGGGTTSFLTGNSYTGTTYINEGMFRGVIGSKAVALGSGNLTFGGSPNSQAVYENDGDFTRTLGTGAGQVQLLGGGGVGGGSSGFSAFGAAIDVNFGGGGATVVWGSAAFDPGIFTLNGGNGTHVVTLVNGLDLGGEQRYIRLDGSGSGTERAVIGIIAGDISNGSVVKRGGGTLLFENAKSYEGGTIVNQGQLWLRGAGTAGANVTGNDIQVAPDGFLRIDSPSNIGSRQMIILQNNDNNTPAAISFGPGYGTGADIRFSTFGATSGIGGTGGNNIFIANTGQTGQARRVAVTISGNSDFQADIPGQIYAVAPTIEAWFGADNGNATFTGDTLSPSGGNVTQTGTIVLNAPAYRLGGHTNNGGVLTIAKANVLTDNVLGVPTPLIVGAPDQTDRNYTDGTIYIPKTQSYSGQVTIGQGGILQVGENGALGAGAYDINLRGGEIRLDVAQGNFGGTVGTQYSARNLNIAGGTGTIRTTTLEGGGFNTVVLGDLTFDANRTLQVLSIGTNFTDLAVNNITFANSANTISLTVGNDNSFQTGAGGLTVNGVIGDQATGLQTLQKNNGGALVLTNANTYDGGTNITQGRVVLSNTAAAGTGGITLVTNSDRRSDIEYRINGAGPFLFNNALATSGGNDGSTRVIVAGPTGPGSEDVTVQIPSLTLGHGGTFANNGGTNSAIYFDGFNGYNIEVTGGVTLNRSIVFRTRGAVTTFDGVVSGAVGSLFQKSEEGTLVLKGANTYLGPTTVYQGYLVLANDQALGLATSDVAFAGTSAFAQVLASGTRTISRNFINSATGGLQTLGGLGSAGPKLFTGTVNLASRGIAVSSVAGGDVTFSGVISGAGAGGITKNGNGTVIFTNANTYSGGTTVNQGILIGNAQASGSPFGSGAITMADGEIRLIGLAGATTTGAGALTTGGGARVGVNATAGGVTTFTFASLGRTGAGSVTFVPATGSLNTNEVFTFNTPPALVNTIIGPWAVAAASGSSNVADYVSLAGSNLITATYGGTGDLDTASGPTQVFNAGATGGTLTADRSVFAFRTDANVNVGAFTLNVGDHATSANGGGIILNSGADITGSAGGRIHIGNTVLNLYVDDSGISTLNVPVTNTRNNANNTQGTVITKFGPGTLEISAAQQFQGNIELNRGTLSFGAPNVLPFFSNLNGTTGSILIMSPGTSVVLNNFDQELGNLSALNPGNSFQFSAGTLDIGTATLTVGREDSSQEFNGQIIGGAGSKFVKVGAGTLTLSNINGNKPNTLETLEVARGVLAAWVNDNSYGTPDANVSAIPSTTTIVLRGGQFTALAIGDSTSNQQRIRIGNNVVHQGGDSIFQTNRATGGGSNKLLTFGTLSLDVQRLLFNNGSTFIPRFDGTVTLTNHARVQTDSPAVFAGVISDGGNGYTLNKIGSSDLSIASDSSTTWSGGVVVTGGTLLFGTRGLDDIRSPGTTIVPLATANAGTGDIIVNQGSAIRITAPSNILTAQGQEVRIYGSERGSTTRVDLLTDALITDYGLRSLTDGSIALGLSEGLWTTPINLARLGSGQWGISALSNTFYTADTLGATVDNRYVFSGTAAGILTITKANVLTGTASVELGKSPVFAGATPAGSGASIRLYDNQSYTGNTTIFRQADAGSIGAVLELTGDSASPVFDVYGRLTLRGAGRVTNDAGVQVNTVNLRPGSNLRLDYSMDVNDSIVTSRLNESNLGLETTENKWGDTTPLVLDGAGINLISSSSRVNQETVGAITIKGGAGITLERSSAGQIVLNTPSITRDGQATLNIRNTTFGELGSINIQSQKLFVTGAAPTLTNGMVAPWMINGGTATTPTAATGRSFLSYDANLGFTNAPFVAGTASAGGLNAFLDTVGGTDIVLIGSGWGVGTTGVSTLTGTKNVYALRVDEDTNARDAILQGGQINIWSGGLIASADDGNRVNFDTTNIYFGDGTTPVEGIVYGGHSTPNTRFGGIVTAANLTFDGPGGFQLTNTANVITGTIQMNGGRLYLDGAGTQGTATNIILHADYANNFNGNQMADLRLRHNSATTTFNLDVTVGENVSYAQIQTERYAGSSTTTLVEFNNLYVLGTDGPAGTLIRMNNSNSNTNVLQTTVIGGSSAVGMNVNANTWRLIGNVTSGAGIVKTGGGVLRFDGANTGFTGGFTLNAGEWRLNGTAADVAGTGDVELNFGTVRLASNVNNAAFFTAPNQRISINGQMTITADRDGGGATNKVIGTNNGGQVITTTNSPYIIFNGSDTTIVEARLIINGSPTIRTDNTTYSRDLIEGTGTFNKAGVSYFHLDNNAANTFSGGYNNFTGVTVVRQANATLGTGPVRVFAGSGLSIGSTAQLGPEGLVQVLTSGTALPIIGTRSIANFNSITAAVAAAISGTGNGVLSIDANQSLSTDPLMATRDGGVFNLWNIGGGEGNGNLTANSVTPWGVGGTEFRLGGGFSTLTVGPATAGSDQFAGAGNKMILGVSHTVGSYGAVTFNPNGNNSYTGGTIVNVARHIDGGYRAFILSLQGGAVGTGNTFRTPLGTGQVDVYGEVRIEGASGTAVGEATGLTNSNVWVFHAGSRLRFDNTTAFTGSSTTGGQATGTIGGGGRWGDNVAINLFSTVIDMVGDNADSAANRELVGDITVGGGSEVVVRRSTGFGAELETSNLFRNGTGTLMLRHDVGLLGVAGTTNTNHFIVTSGAGSAAGQVPVNNNMVDPWIVSRSDAQFLKYDATSGFQIITLGGAPSNYISTAAATLNGSIFTGGNLNDGTVILDVTANPATLGANLDLYALRVIRDINISADSAFNSIIIRSGGLIGAANNSPTINADLYFGSSGLGDGEALIWAAAGTLQINGKIHASQVTLSGTYGNPPNASAFLNIRSDQPQFTGNWNINGGVLQALTPNALSTGQVFINGAHIRDNDNVHNFDGDIFELRYNFNSGTPDLFNWGGGKITVTDIGSIRSVAASDRLDQIPAIDLKTTGGGAEGIVYFRSDASRHTIRTGTLTLYDNFMISVDASSFGPGSTSGVQLGAGNGLGGLNNQGLYDVRLSGDGILSLGDNSASFTGAHTFSVGDGSVRVLHNGAFGAASITANLRSTGVMEIAVANFVPTATVIQEAGSIERWAVSNARGNTGTYSLPAGVHLQVFTDITTPSARTIELSGGSIMGYQPLDYDEVAVIQTIRSGVTINLTADSFLGQIYPAGTSNGANSAFYDMGKLNTTTNLDPSNVGLRGSYLVIDGNITGNFTLTKVGQDVIKLAGSNTFTGLTIEGGIIQIGRENALSPTVALSTRGDGSTGIFDLNGYNQEIGSLSGVSGSINNSGFGTKTLTVNQSGNTSYGGSIEGSVTLHKTGTGKLTLTAVNQYQGGTILEEGILSVAAGTSLGRIHLDVRPNSLTFKGGTLETTATTLIVSTRGITLNAEGGTIATVPGTIFTVNSAITGVGPLTKAGDGTLELANTASNYTGNTNIQAGVLRGGATSALASLSRHNITGGATSGTLGLNGFDQIIGSLASTGPAQAGAAVALGSSTLTVGGDRTQDAVYAGTITGTAAATFRVNGNGAVQTLSTVDHSGQGWKTEVANGQLSLAAGVQLGSGTVALGVNGVTGADDLAVLDLQGITGFANNIAVTADNAVGSTFITASTAADSSITGTVTLARDVFIGATSGQQLGLEGVVSGAGRITVIDGGTLRLATANTYGTGVTGTSGALLDGGTIVRSGTVLLENSSGAGTKHIELGDTTSTIGAAVDRATFTSILGTGSFNANGDGVSATSGGQDSLGTTGFGAFIGVGSTVDGKTYTGADVGTRLLIAGEEANPERNGIYTIVSVSGGVMNLVRADDYETSNQMRYGGQVAVTNGTYSGQTLFMYEEDIVVRNETTQEPIRFRRDVLNPDLALLQNVAGLNVANNIDINATNGSASVILGGSTALTNGTGEFSGGVTLQNLQPGAAETKTLNLTSSTAGGINFSGAITEADNTPVTGDLLSVNKTGNGRVVLSGTNSYTGPTTVSAGTLQFANKVSFYNNTPARWTDTSLVVESGAAAAFNVGGAGEFNATDINSIQLLGTGAGGFKNGSRIGFDTTNAGGTFTYSNVIANTNAGANSIGVVKLGAGSLVFTEANTYSGGTTVSAGTLVANNVIALGTGDVTVNAGAVLSVGSGGTSQELQVGGLLTNNGTIQLDIFSNIGGVNPNSAADFITFTGADRAVTIGGSFVIGDSSAPATTYNIGDQFRLFDWGSIALGNRDISTATFDFSSFGGVNFSIADLAATGYVVVVPEPSRALLLLCGILGLMLRRRVPKV